MRKVNRGLIFGPSLGYPKASQPRRLYRNHKTSQSDPRIDACIEERIQMVVDEVQPLNLVYLPLAPVVGTKDQQA